MAAIGHRRVVQCVLAGVSVIVAGATCATAQCVPGWVPGEGYTGTGTPNAMTMWDPDGPGPTPPVVVAGGEFAVAGSHLVANIAAWNGSDWMPLGAGPGFIVRALTVFQGDLIAAGDSAAGQPSVKRWNGTTWMPMGSMVARRGSFPDPGINCLAVFNNELYIAGDFNAAAQSPFDYIGKWNGTDWEGLPNGPTASVNAMRVFNGQLVVGGAFQRVGTFTIYRIVRWTGSSWLGMDQGVSPNSTLTTYSVNALEEYNGQLIVGGTFNYVVGANVKSLAAWNGVSWSDVGQGVRTNLNPGTVYSLATLNGSLIVGGTFNFAGSLAASNVASWNGSTWSTMSGGVQGSSNSRIVGSMQTLGNVVLVGGSFNNAGSTGLSSTATWDGAQWGPTTPGVNGDITKFVETPTGFYAFGDISFAGTSTVQNFVKWNGSAWRPVEAGGLNGVVEDAVAYNGAVVVSGGFTQAGNVAVPGMAVFDGTQWSSFGPSVVQGGSTLFVWQGDLLASGAQVLDANAQPITGIARWNGASWSRFQPLPSTIDNSRVTEFGVYQGQLFAGFAQSTGTPTIPPTLARWDGSNWISIGTIDYFNPFVNQWQGGAVSTMHEFGGDLFIGGNFDRINGQSLPCVARWNGALTTAGSGLPVISRPSSGVRSLGVFRGRLIACGDFNFNSTPGIDSVAKWDGSDWQPFASTPIGVAGSQTEQLVVHDGDLFFSAPATDTPNQRITASYGRWRECCAADFNADGVANTQDFFDFVTAFFQVAPGADVNNDGAVNSQDFFDFLTYFFAGC